jgi:hypothetical protein
VDLYALALWRKYGLTDAFRDMGHDMEQRLWQDVARFYNARRRNICGPYDRSYGMDMTGYVALLGLWLATVVPPEQAPVPDPATDFAHAADFFFMPVFALLGTNMPEELLPHFLTFQGERLVEREIEAGRRAKSWISETFMLGAQIDTLNSARSSQFHPATAHWLVPDGSVGWIRTRSAGLIVAVAGPEELRLAGDSELVYVFEICAAGATPDMIAAAKWTLPGLLVEVNADEARVSQVGEIITVEYAPSQLLRLHFTWREA